MKYFKKAKKQYEDALKAQKKAAINATSKSEKANLARKSKELEEAVNALALAVKCKKAGLTDDELQSITNN